MSFRFGRAIAILLLAALAVGGRLAPCACEAGEHVAAAEHAPADAGHADDHDCPCPVCHVACAHAAFVVETREPVAIPTDAKSPLPGRVLASEALPSPVRDIFIPPKLG